MANIPNVTVVVDVEKVKQAIVKELFGKNEMANVISGYGLYDALMAEGFPLPDDCRDVTLEMPADGVMMLRYNVFISDENMSKLGKALVRLATPHSAKPDFFLSQTHCEICAAQENRREHHRCEVHFNG